MHISSPGTWHSSTSHKKAPERHKVVERDSDVPPDARINSLASVRHHQPRQAPYWASNRSRQRFKLQKSSVWQREPHADQNHCWPKLVCHRWCVSHDITSIIRVSLRKTRGIIIASSGQAHYEPSGRCSIHCKCIFRDQQKAQALTKIAIADIPIPSAMSLIHFTQSANTKAFPIHLSSLHDEASSFLASHAEQLHGTHSSSRQILRFLVGAYGHNACLGIQASSTPYGIPFVQ